MDDGTLICRHTELYRLLTLPELQLALAKGHRKWGNTIVAKDMSRTLNKSRMQSDLGKPPRSGQFGAMTLVPCHAGCARLRDSGQRLQEEA